MDMTKIVFVSDRGEMARALTVTFVRFHHLVAILNLCFIKAIQNFPLYHMQKTFFAYARYIFIQKKSYKIFVLT